MASPIRSNHRMVFPRIYVHISSEKTFTWSVLIQRQGVRECERGVIRTPRNAVMPTLAPTALARCGANFLPLLRS